MEASLIGYLGKSSTVTDTRYLFPAAYPVLFVTFRYMLQEFYIKTQQCLICNKANLFIKFEIINNNNKKIKLALID